jgi:sulfhydrogenase subunit beta (sulfur reductase)
MTAAFPPTWRISQSELETWLDSLVSEVTLIAPREVDGILLYRPVESSRAIQWGFSRPLLSAKEFFFPPTERLFEIRKSGAQVSLMETLPEGRGVLFGVRPCDARGLLILDALFLHHVPPDPYYARRREQTALVGLACKEMGPTCFCTSMGGAPDDSAGMDVMLFETEGGYLARAVTDKGAALLPGGWTPTDEVPPPANRAAPVYPQLPRSSWPARFDDAIWQQMAERCLSCRACAYVCPTCRCFIVRDEALGPGQFERIRCWDSCAGENYRRVAGGHRPRAQAGERLRNRLFCKFYYYPEQYPLGEASACTGCGRCVEVCPMNIDLTEILTALGRSS